MAEIRISRKSVVFATSGCCVGDDENHLMDILCETLPESWRMLAVMDLSRFCVEQMVLNDDDGDAKDWELFSLGWRCCRHIICLPVCTLVCGDWLIDLIHRFAFSATNCLICMHMRIQLTYWSLWLINWQGDKRPNMVSHLSVRTPTRIISWPCHSDLDKCWTNCDKSG